MMELNNIKKNIENETKEMFQQSGLIEEQKNNFGGIKHGF